MLSFAGRKSEITHLTEENWRGHTQLIVIYGRRRVGKTRLVDEAFKKDVVWKFEGLEGVSLKSQIQNFMSILAQYSQDDSLKTKKVENWNDVFTHLAESLKGKKIVVFLDEFQWLAGMKSYFVSLFKYYWDNYFSKEKKCRFILCGSVSSFIVKKVLYSKALYGRVDTEIHLQPLSLQEIKSFFPERSPREIIDIYMTFGGIPKYLLEINPELSYQQNLNEYAFSQTGYFFQEFQRLFISHFSSTPYYEKILLSLSNQTKTTDELAKDLNIIKGGSFSQVLNDLVLAGFIEKNQPLDKNINSRLIRYRLLDEYLNFYFSFIQKNIIPIQKGHHYFQNLNVSLLHQWQGYAFERLCRRHSSFIAEYLKFSGIQYAAGSWFRMDKKNRSGSPSGAQVDLMFVRGDHMLTLCEAKYVDHLPSSVIAEFEKRVGCLKYYYPHHGVQKVLLLGKSSSIPQKVRHYFDKIILAENLFVKG